MRHRTLGKTGLCVSEIGLGCQSLGGGIFHGSRREALALIAHALDAGVTYFDTADHYTLGRSEALLGDALRPVRERVVISTKIGTRYTPAARLLLSSRPALRAFGRWLKPAKQRIDYFRSTQRRGDFSADYLRDALVASLRRLQTDYVDLLFLHKPPHQEVLSGRVAEVVGMLAGTDSVRHVGISCETVDDALSCLAIPGIAALQVTVNLVDQVAADQLLPEARDKGIGIIARNPRAAGLLTASLGDITAETYARDRSAFEASRSVAREFGFLARPDRTLAQAAIRYALQLPGVSAVTPRANVAAELDEALSAATLPELTGDELDRVRRLGRDAMARIDKYPYRSPRSGSPG